MTTSSINLDALSSFFGQLDGVLHREKPVVDSFSGLSAFLML